MGIEHDILRQINFGGIISDFANARALKFQVSFERHVIPSQCMCVIFSYLVSSKS